jgi:hypothetical protein
LALGQVVREVREDPARKGDVPRFNDDAGSLRKTLDDGKENVASAGASSVLVQMIFDAFVVMFSP